MRYHTETAALDQTPRTVPPDLEPPYVSHMEARVAVLEQIAKDMKEILGRSESRMDRMDTRFDTIDTRFDRMESRLERIEDGQSADLKWRLGCGLGAVAFLFATMSHGFHWL